MSKQRSKWQLRFSGSSPPAVCTVCHQYYCHTSSPNESGFYTGLFLEGGELDSIYVFLNMYCLLWFPLVLLLSFTWQWFSKINVKSDYIYKNEKHLKNEQIPDLPTVLGLSRKLSFCPGVPETYRMSRNRLPTGFVSRHPFRYMISILETLQRWASEGSHTRNCAICRIFT